MVRKYKEKTKLRNSQEIDLDSLSFPDYERVISQIKKRLGKRPALPKDLPLGDWTEQALKVLQERYLVKDEKGVIIESPDDMCWRVSWDIASAEVRWGSSKSEVERIAREFYKILVSHEFLPNSPTLMNAGTGNGLQYSACFVLPVEDSMEGIFDAIKYQAMIHKTGGGTGFAFSRLRPKGSRVRTSTGTASGPVSFMRIFDAATNEVKQGGKRRGANMGILRVDHPDILDFIHCKEEGGITNFNISVAVTDAFMEAYDKGTDYDLIDPRDKSVVGKLSARKVFEEIAEAAWRTGDPGLIFIDRINNSTANPVPSLGPIESTNPCGEQPLYPYDSCNLGSIFLTYFIKYVNGKKEVDWEKLKKVVHLAVRFLDDVIEVNPYPLPQIRKVSLAIRRIGLGVGGWADMLIDLGIPFDSDEALSLAEKIMKFIHQEAVDETQRLAEKRGPFPLWPISIYKNGKPRRNSTVTTIAPTGSISIIAGASSGIEPLFAIAFQHIVKDKHLDRTLTFFNPKFEQVAKERGFLTEEIRQKVAEHGVIRDIEEIPEDVRSVFATAHEIYHDWHIKHQAVFQKYTENAVSKTINMAKNVSVGDVRDAYLLAWKTGCMGITVFRDGCKETQVLNLGVKEKNGEKVVSSDDKESLIKRPFVVKGATYRIATPLGSAFITINEDERGEPLELFINIGKAGSDINTMAAALGRTISTALRFKASLSARERAIEIIHQLEGMGGRRSIGFGPNKILSLPDAVATALSIHLGLKLNNSSFATNQKGGGVFLHQNGNGKIVGNEITGSGVRPDLANAVMSAQFPVQTGTPESLRGDDHTTALAESSLTSGSVDQLSLESVDLPKVANDICPSCGSGSYVYQEGCAKCFSCGYSEC